MVARRSACTALIGGLLVAAALPGCSGGDGATPRADDTSTTVQELEEPMRAGSFDTVVPRPTEVTPGEGTFPIRSDTVVVVAAGTEADDAVVLLRRSLSQVAGVELPVQADASDEDGGSAPRIVFTAASGELADELGPEGYELDIGADEVGVVAAGPAGFGWAVQTIRQLLPPESLAAERQAGTFALPVGRVHDVPRYGWRGTMLDVARHFFDVDDVKAFVDVAAAYKLNRVHLHLSDDQGWRLEIRSHPELAEVGGLTEVGGGPGGSYTQDEYREIVEHAAALGVVVVPEIDMPGHTNAALVADGSLSCDGQPREPYTEVAVGFSTLCVEAESTYEWVDDVVGELAELTPGDWIHIGGDESNATDHEGYRRFVERVTGIVADHGKVPVGWEEIGSAPLDGSTVAQHWILPERAIAAAEQGADVVLSPADRTYFDMKYDETTPIGHGWAGPVNTQKVYDWDPDERVPGLDAAQTLGVEAPVWTEFITDRSELQQMTLPRIPALAEVGWSAQAERDWDDFSGRVAAHGARWDAAGWSWTRDPVVPWPA